MTEKQEMDSRIEEIKWDDKSEFLEVMLVKDISNVLAKTPSDNRSGLNISRYIIQLIEA